MPETTKFLRWIMSEVYKLCSLVREAPENHGYPQ
jgi:hypothetical protein